MFLTRLALIGFAFASTQDEETSTEPVLTVTEGSLTTESPSIWEILNDDATSAVEETLSAQEDEPTASTNPLTNAESVYTETSTEPSDLLAAGSEEVKQESPILSSESAEPAFIELELQSGDIYEGEFRVTHKEGSRKFKTGPIEIQILMAHAVDRHPLDPHLEDLPEDAPALIVEKTDSSKSAYERHMRRGSHQAVADTCCFSRRRVRIAKSVREPPAEPVAEEVVPITEPADISSNDKPLLYMNMIASLTVAARELQEIQRLTRRGCCRRKMDFSEASDLILRRVIPSINQALSAYNDSRRGSGGVLTSDIDKFGRMQTVFETRDKLRVWATANAVLKEEWPQLCTESDLVFTHTIQMLQILVQFAK